MGSLHMLYHGKQKQPITLVYLSAIYLPGCRLMYGVFFGAITLFTCIQCVYTLFVYMYTMCLYSEYRWFACAIPWLAYNLGLTAQVRFASISFISHMTAVTSFGCHMTTVTSFGCKSESLKFVF